MDVPVLVDQQEPIYISSVRTQNVCLKTWLDQWMIETDEDREKERERKNQENRHCQCNFVIIMTMIYNLSIHIKVNRTSRGSRVVEVG